MNPFKLYNPIRPFMYWYNARRMDRYIENLLDDRLKIRRVRMTENTKRSKSVVDLALDTYLKDHATSKKEDEKMDSSSKKEDKNMDSTFKSFAITQVKTFMFAGYDSTSSTIAYMYHLLSKNPHALDIVRQEHDAVLGFDVSLASQILAKTPHVLQKLHYSHAIIKETLRLFPAGITSRTGRSGDYMEHEGIRYPTEGICVSEGSEQVRLTEN
jgi:cytochrome P450